MIRNRDALIGYTGFVGSNLLKQKKFDNLYNSENIKHIPGEEFDLVVCAAAPAVKWYADRHPQEDFKVIKRIMDSLDKINTNQFVLISTIDVYPKAFEVNEDSIIDLKSHLPYGKHRRKLELFANEKFDATIIRLPGIFGDGIKKNLIYDLLNNNQEYLNHRESILQFYNLDNIWADISKVLKNDIKLINLGTEPITITEIARECFGIDYKGDNTKLPLRYDMQTKYGALWKRNIPYLYPKSEILKDLKLFVKKYTMVHEEKLI